VRTKSEKEEKDVVYYFIFDPTRKRDRERGHPPRNAQSKAKKKMEKTKGI
jgi:hypothetical protein